MLTFVLRQQKKDKQENNIPKSFEVTIFINVLAKQRSKLC